MSRLQFTGTTSKERNAIKTLEDAVDTNLNAIVDALSIIKDNWQDENSVKVLPQFDASVTDAIKANNTCLTKANEAMQEMENIIRAAGGSGGGTGAGVSSRQTI